MYTFYTEVRTYVCMYVRINRTLYDKLETLANKTMKFSKTFESEAGECTNCIFFEHAAD